MKTALCLSGYFNSLRDKSSRGIKGYEYIKKHIFSKIEDLDVYIHSWDVPHTNVIKNCYEPFNGKIIIEPQIDFRPLVTENGLDKIKSHPMYVKPEHIFSQFYSVQKAFELLKDSGIHYDIVVKSRFDLGYINRDTSGPGKAHKFPVQCINFDPTLDMDYLYLANWNYFESEGPADMWFYSNLENMLHFSEFFDIIKEDIKPNTGYETFAGTKNNGMLNAVKAWKWCLIKSNLWDKKIPLDSSWE